MTTGAEFANIVNKRLMGFESFGPLMLDYLRELNRVTVDSLYDQGSFNEKIPVSGPAANTLRIVPKTTAQDGIVHDGYGHILDLETLMIGGQLDTVFENTAATVYDIGAGFVVRPSGIQINPRTGKPEYLKLIESVGDSADPSLVTDNGNGTITFRVNSLVNTSGGESIAGRQVRVFKKVPADGATSESIAIELLTVAFSGGNNSITTAGALGQATISTVASDYTVQLVGLSVRRQSGPAPLTGTGKHFLIGTVTGNGGVPVPSNTTQKVISTSVLSLTGAAQIGVDNTQFTTSATTTDHAAQGGIGTGADLDAPANVQAALNNLDKRVIARRTAITLGPSGSGQHDFVGATAPDTIQTIADGGTYRIRKSASIYRIDNTGKRIGAAANDANPRFPVLEGHDYHGKLAGDEPAFIEPNGPSTGFHGLRGRFKRLHFKANSVSNRFWGTTADVAAGNGQNSHFEDCRIGFGDMVLAGGLNTGPREPSSFRNCRFGPEGFGRFSDDAALMVYDWFGGDAPWAVFEHCFFNASNSFASQEAVLQLDSHSFQWKGIGANPVLPVVFRDCVIDMAGSADNAMYNLLVTMSSLVVFENCSFIGKTGQTLPLIRVAAGGDATFINCGFFAKERQAIDLSVQGAATFINCYVETGTGTAVSNPQLIVAPGTGDGGGYDAGRQQFINTHVCIQSVQTSGASGSFPVLEFGGSPSKTMGGNLSVDGLYVVLLAANLPQAALLSCWGTRDNNPLMVGSSYRNIVVDLQYKPAAATARVAGFSGNHDPTVVFLGGVFVGNQPTIYQDVTIINYASLVPAADNANSSILIVNGARVQGLVLDDGTPTASGTNTYRNLLQLDNFNDATEGMITSVSDFQIRYGHQVGMSAAVVVLNDPHCELHLGTIVDPSSSPKTYAAGFNIIDVLGPYCEVDNVKFKIFAAIANLLGSIINGGGNLGLFVHDCTFHWLGDNATSQRQRANVVQSSGEQVRVSNNLFFIAVHTGGIVDVVSLTGNGAMFWGNILQSNNASIPTFTNSGTGSIGGSTHNVVKAA